MRSAACMRKSGSRGSGMEGGKIEECLLLVVEVAGDDELSGAEVRPRRLVRWAKGVWPVVAAATVRVAEVRMTEA